MKNDPTTLVAILDALLTRPHSGLGSVAKTYNIATSTAFRWQSESSRDEKDGNEESPYNIEWLNIKAFWHRHIALARRLSIQQIDASVISRAVHGDRVPMVNRQTGMPMWEVDPVKAADALDPETWRLYHGDDPINVYKIDPETGGLCQLFETIPASAALLLGAAKSLIPSVYGDHVSIDHHHQIGGVLRIAATPPAQVTSQSTPQLQAPIVDGDFTEVIDDQTMDAPQPTNTLAVAERLPAGPAGVQEFEQTFGGKRLIEVVYFYDDLGVLMAPRPELTIVENSSAHRKYTEAGFECATVTATSQVELGYCNPFLLTLANAEAAHDQTNTKQTRPRSGEDSPLVRDLRAKLAEGVKNPHPTAPVNIGNKEPAGGDQPDDARPRDPQRGTPQQQALNASGRGRGNVPPGGFRISK